MECTKGRDGFGRARKVQEEGGRVRMGGARGPRTGERAAPSHFLLIMHQEQPLPLPHIKFGSGVAVINLPEPRCSIFVSH